MAAETRERASGLLLHPTCLPNRVDAIGTIGEEARLFVDWLARTGQELWQILPLNPTGFADSPYASFSAFAGNPYLIDLRALVRDGDLADEDLAAYVPPTSSFGTTDFGWLYVNKIAILAKAYERFRLHAKSRRKTAFEKFCEENAYWLEAYAMFMAIKQSRNGASWDTWEPELRKFGPFADIGRFVIKEDYEFYRYVQWVFFSQWQDLREYANKKGVRIIGDVPMFVAYDSADVWSNQELFFLDAQGRTTVVAGVPPDYFSETGQLWGNPLYKWETMKKDGYAWWVKRLKCLLSLVDVIRIDHFRAFAQYWEIKAGEPTAINGTWVDGPGEAFFEALQKAFDGEIPVIAEDLGLITPDVEKLRDDFRLPGMKIFEFAPWGEEFFEADGVQYEFKVHRYLPENYPRNCVAYLGTHDNDTFASWYATLDEGQRAHLHQYLGEDDPRVVAWATLERLWKSDANLVLVSVPDLLGLGSEARLNTPGSCGSHNWSWRLASFDALDDKTAERLKILTGESSRRR